MVGVPPAARDQYISLCPKPTFNVLWPQLRVSLSVLRTPAACTHQCLGTWSVQQVEQHCCWHFCWAAGTSKDG